MAPEDFPIDRLAPHANYNHKINITDACSMHNIKLVRLSDLKGSFTKFGSLKTDAIKLKRIPKLSMNILGEKFKPEDSYYRITGNASNSWDGKYLPKLDDHIEEISVQDRDLDLIFINGNSIHDKDIPYNHAGDKPLKKKIESLPVEISERPLIKDGKYILNGRTYVKHDPTNLNYWHAELAIESHFNEEIEKYKDSAYVKEICERALKDITANAKPVLIENYNLSPTLYIKEESIKKDTASPI